MASMADREASAEVQAPADAASTRPALDPLDPFAELNADLDELQHHRRNANRAAAAQYRVAARIMLRSGASPREKNGTPFFRSPSAIEWRALRAETALALHVGEPTAEKILGFAPILVDSLPRTMAAFSEGRISESNARILAEQSIGLTPSEREDLEGVLLPEAETSAPAPFLKRARAERDKRRPEGAEERAKKAAVTDAGVWLDHAPDGRAYLSANLDAVEASAGFDRLTSMAIEAHNTPGETRSMPELRAAAFGDLLLTGVCSDGAGTGIVGRVSVTVPALSLLGKTTELAELGGHGPIDVGTAATLLAETRSFSRVITDPVTGDVLAVDRKQYRTATMKADAGSGADTAADPATESAAAAVATAAPGARPNSGIGLAAFSRVLTDPVAGSVLAVERTQYRPPELMKRWVQLRDGVCMFPNCTRPAMRCQLDHIQEWHRDNGATNAVNLMCLCIGHHALKTLTGWCPVAIGGGVIVWTSPAGRVYRKDPQHRMEPVPGLDIVSAGATGTACDAGAPSADTSAGFAATPVWEVDLPAPLTRVTVRAGRPQRLFSDANADAYAQWLVSRDWTGADPNDDNNHVDPSEEGYVPPPEWEPDVSDPPPDPPIDAYFPGGIPGSALITMLQRGMSEEQILQRGTPAYEWEDEYS